MYVSSIFLDRFGHQSNLRLGNLSNGLNVLCGPLGSGHTSLVDFLRGMCTGFDAGLREQYVPRNSQGYGGTMSVETDQGWVTISRYEDGSPEGRLTVEGQGERLLGRPDHRALFGNIPTRLLERAFFINFQNRPQLDDLLLAASLHGYQLVRRADPTEQLRSLELSLSEKRHRLASLPTPKLPGPNGKSRPERHPVSKRGEKAETNPRQQRLQESAAELERREFEIHAELENLDRTWNELDAQRRRREVRSDTTVPRRDELSRRLSAMDVQLARWNRTLHDVVSRKQRAAERTDNRQQAVAVAPGNATPRRHLLALQQRIEESQQSLKQISAKQCDCVCDDLRAAFTDVLHAMQDDVDQLSNDLNYWQSYHLYRQAAGERDQLARCELELRQTIQTLVEKRQSILCRIVEKKSKEACDLDLGSEHKDQLHKDELQPSNFEGSANLNPGVPDGLTELNAELVRVDQSRHQARRALQEITVDLAKVRDELQELGGDRAPAPLTRSAEDKSAEIQRAAQEAEMRQALMRDINSLEEQLRRLHSDASSFNLVQNAADHLRRLSSNRWLQIDVRSPHDVSVEDAHGRQRKYNELDAGGRDQVYLAFCLALVTACGSKASGIPLVMSGAFTHYPAKDVRDALELLRDFAQDRQVLCVTQFEHVVGLARTLHVPVHPLPASAMAMAMELDAAAAAETRRRLAPAHLASAAARSGNTTASQLLSQTSTESQLSEYDLIERAPSMDVINASRLRKIGILRVGDLLRVPATEIAADLRQWGITVDMVRSWQSQVRLVCSVRGLGSYDARILVACGITDPSHLGDIHSKALRDRLREFSLTPEGQAVLMSGTESEMSRVLEWIQSPRDSELHVVQPPAETLQATAERNMKSPPAKLPKPGRSSPSLRRSHKAA